MPEWIWWVGGPAVYIFIIGIAYSVFREEGGSSEKDDFAILGAIVWPATAAFLLAMGVGAAGFWVAEQARPEVRRKRKLAKAMERERAKRAAKDLELRLERELGIKDE